MPNEMEVTTSNANMMWCLLVAATMCDAKEYRIPNQLIILGYISGLFLNLSNLGVMGIKVFCIRAMCSTLALLLLYLLGGLGSGDIKLFSVMCVLVGANVTIQSFVYSVFLSGLVAIAICIKEQKISKRKLHYSYYITAGYFLNAAVGGII